MLKARGGFITKPSKASLKSRGLSTNVSRACRPGSNASSVDGRYSLYSTESDDAVGVYKGLDKCAQLLTNILQINGEKGTQNAQHSHSKNCQFIVQKTKKQICNPISKTDTTRMKRPKRKPRTNDIHIPTATQSNHKSSMHKPSYNERVVASTPVLTAEQRKRQQELQHRESALQQQIDLLQEQYENLQKDGVDQSEPDSNSEIPLDGTLQMNTNEGREDGENSPGHENRSAKRSLEFTTNAEKPFIDSHKENRSTSPSNRSTSVIPNKKPVEEIVDKTARKVKIAKQDFSDARETNDNTCGTAKNNRSTVERWKSPSSSKFDRHNAVDGKENGKESGREDGKEGGKEGGKESGKESGKEDGKEENCAKTDILKQRSPQKNTDHLRILTYLVGELKAVLGSSNLAQDVEVERLLMEIENEICLLSYPVQSPVTPAATPVGNTSKQHDIDIEVALQPLRSENSDLRRKLRITNQRLREMENQCRQIQEKPRFNPPREGVIESLHHQLLEERGKIGKERHEKQLAEKELSEHIQEKKRTIIILSEKEEEIGKISEELRRQREKTTAVTSQMKLQLESNAISLRARDKQVALLNLALEQRDTEIERLTELTRGLQQSLTKVLTNVQGLHPDDVISEVSSLYSFLDSWQPPVLKAADLSLDLTSNNETRGPKNHEVAREYDENKGDICGPTMYNRDSCGAPVYNRDSYKQVVYGKGSPEVKQQDSMSFLSSSAEESTFKQELANLDTAIARLQENLHDKL